MPSTQRQRLVARSRPRAARSGGVYALGAGRDRARQRPRRRAAGSTSPTRRPTRRGGWPRGRPSSTCSAEGLTHPRPGQPRRDVRQPPAAPRRPGPAAPARRRDPARRRPAPGRGARPRNRPLRSPRRRPPPPPAPARRRAPAGRRRPAPAAGRSPYAIAGGSTCRTWDDFLTVSAQRWAAPPRRADLGPARGVPAPIGRARPAAPRPTAAGRPTSGSTPGSAAARRPGRARPSWTSTPRPWSSAPAAAAGRSRQTVQITNSAIACSGRPSASSPPAAPGIRIAGRVHGAGRS